MSPRPDQKKGKPDPAGKNSGQAGGEEQWLLPKKSREYLADLFKVLKEPVDIWVFTKPGHLDAYGDFCTKFARDLGRVTDKVRPHFRTDADPEAATWHVTHFPSILLQPDLYSIRYTGAPSGEEGKSFIETVLLLSERKSGLSDASKEILAALTEKRHIQVFVNPTCPYCPMQVVNAFRAAIERPDLISAECVEINEHPDLADKYGVGSVPQTVINDTFSSLGLQPEANFMSEVLTLKPAEQLGAQGLAPEVAEEVDLVIIGAGPAGLTAGIYAARGGLKSIILEKKNIGGQVAVTPVVENYPGYANIAGVKLMDLMALQARQYVDIHEMEEVQEIKLGKHVEVLTDQGLYSAKAVVLATGASWRMLGVPGETELFGHGVNVCATCDGYLYKGRRVVVVGGGNTALTDALYLKNLGADVMLVHRRDQFRGEKYLQDSLRREGIPTILDSVVEEILGKDKVTGVRVRNVKTGQVSEVDTDGVFVAIGEYSNTKLAEQLGLKLTEGGTIEVDSGGRTSIPRIYAAGDVTGGVRQIVTAVGQGAVVAQAAFEDIAKRETK